MKKNNDPNTTINPAHGQSVAQSPHNRDQLRRKLLKMILQNESQRRGLISKPSTSEAAADLSVFDPDDRIGQELVSASTPNKSA
jgi:hypothetical protein